MLNEIITYLQLKEDSGLFIVAASGSYLSANLPIEMARNHEETEILSFIKSNVLNDYEDFSPEIIYQNIIDDALTNRALTQQIMIEFHQCDS